MGTLGAGTAIQASYFIAAALFIFGLKRMSSPVTARSGIVWAGVGMVVATLITFLTPGMSNYGLMTVAIAIGGIAAWVTGRRVAMTNMPQMIALYNGMGGGAAGAIAAVVLGVTMTLPIGGADMPVVISLYNALTGLAVAFEGFVLNNAAMIIAGTVVGSAGTLLTQLMAKAMNRGLGNVLFSGFGESGAASTTAVTGSMKAIEAP